VGYLANQRSGTHSTKTRGEVSGGGAKPWKQKGTGNARAGSNRSPLWRKGGIIFGPRPKDYSHRISKQKRNLALKMALSTKLHLNGIVVLDSFKIEEVKTKKVVEILKNLKINGSKVLLVVEKAEEKLRLASRNIPDLVIIEAKNMNAYEVMWADKIIFTEDAIEALKKTKEGIEEK
jgi:large subunit ribosomal protein L4